MTDCPDTLPPASGTAAPTSAAQNLAGNMLYASANLANDHHKRVHRPGLTTILSKSQRLTVRSYIDKFIQPSGDTPGNVLSVLNLNTWNETFGEKGWYFNELLQHTWTVNSNTVNTATVLWTQQSVHNGTDSVGQERQTDVLVALHRHHRAGLLHGRRELWRRQRRLDRALERGPRHDRASPTR